LLIIFKLHGWWGKSTYLLRVNCQHSLYLGWIVLHKHRRGALFAWYWGHPLAVYLINNYMVPPLISHYKPECKAIDFYGWIFSPVGMTQAINKESKMEEGQKVTEKLLVFLPTRTLCFCVIWLQFLSIEVDPKICSLCSIWK